MAQHFLLSAESRTLSLKAIYQAGEAKAYETFKRMRWNATEGRPVCPKCGCLDHYEIPTRRKFKCAACHAQYSVTSGTMFASRKLSFTDLLAAICLFVNGSKGMSAVQFSRDLDVQYKTAFVLAHKLREALAAEVDGLQLTDHVEVDGQYHGGAIRPENRKEDRIDRRLAKHQTGTRRVVVAFRQRKGRTLTFVTRNEAEGVQIAKTVVSRTATISADEASHWDALHAGWETHRINHSEAYSDGGKGCTNQVESFFARLRRMVRGQHHFVSPKYLYQYANHAAWLEDHRRRSNGGNAFALLGGALNHPVSRVWAGYWQRAAS